MSGKHWLERESQNSPGLQRIQEAQQAAALAKTQEAQRMREAEIAAQEEKQRIATQESLGENMTVRILPIMNAVRDFANRTKTYPIGGKGPVDSPLELVSPAKIEVEKMFPSGVDIKLVYGFKGSRTGSTKVCDDWVNHDYKSVEKYGINVRVVTDNNRAEVLVLTEKAEREIIPAKPAMPGGTWFKVYHPPHPAVPEREKLRIVSAWVKIENPLDDELVKHYLGEAFHNPAHLGAGALPYRQEVTSQPEPQTSAGIAGLVKGFLGLK